MRSVDSLTASMRDTPSSLIRGEARGRVQPPPLGGGITLASDWNGGVQDRPRSGGMRGSGIVSRSSNATSMRHLFEEADAASEAAARGPAGGSAPHSALWTAAAAAAAAEIEGNRSGRMFERLASQRPDPYSMDADLSSGPGPGESLTIYCLHCMRPMKKICLRFLSRCEWWELHACRHAVGGDDDDHQQPHGRYVLHLS